MRRSSTAFTALLGGLLAISLSSMAGGCGGSGGSGFGSPDGGSSGGGSGGSGGGSGGAAAASAGCPDGGGSRQRRHHHRPAPRACSATCRARAAGRRPSPASSTTRRAKESALQHRGLRARRGLCSRCPKGVPTGADACNCARALQERRGREHDDRRRRKLQADQRAGRQQRAARHPGRQVAHGSSTSRRPPAGQRASPTASLSLPGTVAGGDTERQHARHRRLDRLRRHARVPDAAHRPPGDRVRRGRGRQRPHPRLLGRRHGRRWRWRWRRCRQGRVAWLGRARERHEPLGLAGRT